MLIRIAFLTMTLFIQNKEIKHPVISEKIDSFLSNLAQEDVFSGSVLVAQAENILFEKSYNWADREKKISNNLLTPFKIASITKPITAVAILQLCEKNVLSLNDTIDKFVPSFKNGFEIQIQHLLSHTSGIPDVSSIEIFQEIKNHRTTPKQTVELIKNQELLYIPGSRHEYSSSNYLILAYIIELITHQSYEEYIYQHILLPTGMKNSFFYPHDQEKKCIAVGYIKENNTILEAPFLHMSWPSGSGGLYSIPHDLLYFSNALDSNILLTKESYKKMISVVMPMHNKEMGYGFGFEIGQFQNKKYIGHPGKMYGFSTYFLKFLEDEVTIILLENIEDSLDNTKQKILKLAEMLFKK